MAWFLVLLYLALVPATWWLTGHVQVFSLVCVDDRGRMAVVWPFTWLAAGLTALLCGLALVHDRIIRRGEGEPG